MVISIRSHAESEHSYSLTHEHWIVFFLHKSNRVAITNRRLTQKADGMCFQKGWDQHQEKICAWISNFMENKTFFLNWVISLNNLQKWGVQNGFSLEQALTPSWPIKQWSLLPHGIKVCSLLCMAIFKRLRISMPPLWRF